MVTAERSLLVFTHRHVFLDRMDRVYIIRDGRLVDYPLDGSA
ncbi:MAG: hypothetical protein U0521_17790 [Anaerolineae bacterium]